MENRIRLVGLYATALFAIGCAGSLNDNTGTGGSSASGGQSGGTGGTSASGGSPGTGGTASGTGGAKGGSVGTGTGGTATGTGGAKGGAGGTGTGGSAAGTGGSGTGGAKGGAGGTGTGGSAAGTGGSGTGGTGTGGAAAGSCLDDLQNGTETGVDCGGSCGTCPNYKLSNGPNTGDTTGSGCNGGPAFMCVRDMVYSPEFKTAESDDFAMATNPQFVYGVVGHDKDTGGLDTESGGNACCQCYQLIFTSPRDNVSGVATPKPMIVQAFNTGAGGGKNFDIFMGSGGEGANTAGCSAQYSAYPSVGQPNNGGIRTLNVSQCANNNMVSSSSIATMSCQSAIAADCDMIAANNASVESSTPGLLRGDQPAAEPLPPQLERHGQADRMPREPDARDGVQAELAGSAGGRSNRGRHEFGRGQGVLVGLHDDDDAGLLPPDLRLQGERHRRRQHLQAVLHLRRLG